MATCMYCGAQIADGLKFCTSCGAALPVEAPIEATVIEASDQPIQQPGTFQPDAAQPFQQPSYDQTGAQQPGPQPPYQQQLQFAAPGVQQPVQDSGSIGWAILGFFIPIVGLILFLVWKNTKPQCAKMAGIGAIVGFCLGLIMNMSFLR